MIRGAPPLLWVLFLGFLALILVACSDIPVHDAEFCGDLGDDIGASCFHMLRTDQDRHIAPADWPAMRFGMLCTSPDSFADNKATIQKLCLKAHCIYLNETDTFFKKVDGIKAQTERISPAN